MDRVDSGTRSRIMRAIRGKHTGPERAVRMRLVREGWSFRMHVRELPGSPDFFVGNFAVFVDGDFWHGRNGLPKSNIEFWRKKFGRNAERDGEADEALFRMGIVSWRIWESEIKTGIYVLPCDVKKLKGIMH